MENSRIEYVCKKCGWRKSILAVWADLRPKKCMNKKCNCSFLLEPDMLGVRELAKVVIQEEPKEELRAEPSDKKQQSHRRGR